MSNFMTKVELGMEISPNVLENILVDAAKDVGWKASIRNGHRREYSLGSVHEKYVYTGSEVILKGAFLRAARADYQKDRTVIDHFIIYSGSLIFRSGVATDTEVKKYLDAVSQRVQEYRLRAVAGDGPSSTRSLVA